MTANARRLLLLRHGEVVSHRGDQPLTPAGRTQAEGAGRRLAALQPSRVRVLSGETRRTRETAALVAAGLTATGGAVEVSGPEVAFGLRNPDLYLGGVRVDMVSSPEAFAEQVPRLAPADVLAVPFFEGWFSAADRIEWWVTHQAPPGESATDVARRVIAFGTSLGDLGAAAPDTVVCVTHSPVLRAVALQFTGADPGEPGYLNGYALELGDGPVRAAEYDPFS